LRFDGHSVQTAVSYVIGNDCVHSLLPLYSTHVIEVAADNFYQGPIAVYTEVNFGVAEGVSKQRSDFFLHSDDS
jgi:hypothetical protein